ncbi:diguanylate cyclase [Tamilnaduibacter salinus]|uniref:diguanylate cyclase n=1 Tax=Tamilnaduibacter salinus TaxID=1484056 RepID=A0A2A2HZ66_9GAMM|nr:sensor domain-containing diguanylate cyclase [Tamilnaduibacter salinus]PAV24951.1 diguanylate cyclase [Tamilnaduibacter salinus]
MSPDNTSNIADFHWLIDMIDTIEVGMIVLDNQDRVQVWNDFMENHSGMTATRVRGRSLFDVFPDLPADWLRRKMASARLLNTRMFSSWEQRPYLFRFRNSRPVTGTERFMYQNITISPLTNAQGDVQHVCLLIYDVTDAASGRQALERANRQLEALSQVDRLTGLLNRGTWETILIEELERHRRYGQDCALVMMDIDHFKQVNDVHGHLAGDEVLRMVANVFRECLRQVDIAGRYGGEEFALMLPETGNDGALLVCERLREAIEARSVTTLGGETLSVTVSLGVATVKASDRHHEEWLERADKALYEAKNTGRNRVVVSSLEC